MADQARERAFAASAAGALGSRVLASPLQYYVDGADNLRIEAINSAGGIRVAVHYRFLDPERGIIVNEATLSPTADRAVSRRDVRLSIGALLNLTVFVNQGTPHYGQTFVRVQLIRGDGAAAIVMGTIVQGYVTASQDIAWPGSPVQSSIEGNGNIRAIIGTTPGVGNQIAETVPEGARWRLMSVYAVLTTDATVITRQAQLLFVSLGQQRFFSPSPAGQTASSGFTYTWACGTPLAAVLKSGISLAGLPGDAWLCDGDEFRINATNMQPGDQWSNVTYVTQEWLEGA